MSPHQIRRQNGDAPMTVRKSVTVKRPLADAFSLFTEQIDSWWPLKEGFSFGGERAKEIYLETRQGGRFYERFTDGEEYVVGHVTVCEPPRRIVFTWEDPDWEGPTEVEVRFAAEGNATRVEVEHRGWEVGPKATAAGKSYDGGWDFVLGKYTAAA
jgi:uncharacterized protein YndB with AHSA1/START domain